MNYLTEPFWPGGIKSEGEYKDAMHRANRMQGKFSY